MSRQVRISWLGGVLLGAALACAGPAGCSEDDDDATASPTTVVVTNQVDGTVVTNIVVPEEAEASNVAAGDEAAAPAAVLNVTGEWNGVMKVTLPMAGETAHLDLDLTQDGQEITGQFFVDGEIKGVGRVVGTLEGGDVLWVTLLDGPAGFRAHSLEGRVNASSTDYRGTWETVGEKGGTFALQK